MNTQQDYFSAISIALKFRINPKKVGKEEVKKTTVELHKYTQRTKYNHVISFTYFVTCYITYKMLSFM
jgi:hypothetical protein